MDYGLGNGIDSAAVSTTASNVRAGSNSAYTLVTFHAMYPQFGVSVISDSIVQLYINLADDCIKASRWRGAWEIAMGLFVAHFCYLYLRSSALSGAGKDAIIAAGQTQGIITSESVDGVSYSMDVASVMSDLEGFAMWKTSDFGLQLASMAKMYGKGGMMV